MYRSLSAALVALSTLLVFTGPASAATHNPVIFVHGYNGSASNWNEMIADFKSDGYADGELYAWNYDTHQSNEITAEQLSRVVDETLARTGASQVDIVTHSMGGLSSRWYLKFHNGTTKVDDWVSLAGPNHGTTTAAACSITDTSCQEMQAGSNFLTTLNEGDETPGAVTYGTWWSRCDEIISPPESTVLAGAQNTETACIGHVAFLTDDAVSSQVRAFVS